MKKTKTMSYNVHSFMIRELSLGGSELLVFAIIYSFTVGAGKVYYGAQKNLAEWTGMSLSTVKRALSSLLQKGYIEKCKTDGCEGYRSLKDGRDKYDNPELPPNDAGLLLQTPEFLYQGIDACEMLSEIAPPAKYEFYFVGPHRRVAMTAEQYKRLLDLVDQLTLTRYILRLEKKIIEERYRVGNPYKVIRKWILEDAAV